MKHFLTVTLMALSIASLQAVPAPFYHLTTVSHVLVTRNNLTMDDHYITLIGHVTRKDGDGDYWFTDGTGNVRLDAGDFELPVGPKIVLGGRIDQAYLGIGNLEVDVKSWKFLKAP